MRVVDDVWNFWNFWDFLKSGTSWGIIGMLRALDHFGLLSRPGNYSEVKVIGKNKKEWKRMKIKRGSKVKAVKGHTVSQSQADWTSRMKERVSRKCFSQWSVQVCRNSGQRIVVCMSRSRGQIKQRIFYEAFKFWENLWLPKIFNWFCLNEKLDK